MKYKLRMHLEYECALRPAICPQCAATMPFTALEAHERGGPNAAPTCPVVSARADLAAKHATGAAVLECWQGCEQLVKKAEMDRHSRRACVMRLVACPNNCGESIAHCRLKDHVANFCNNPFFVASRRMITKYRHIRKYARPWATGDDANSVAYEESDGVDGADDGAP